MGVTEIASNDWMLTNKYVVNKLVEIHFTESGAKDFMKDFCFLKKDNIPETALALIKSDNYLNKLIKNEENDINNFFNQSRYFPLKEILFMKVQQCEISMFSYLKALEILGNKGNVINIITE